MAGQIGGGILVLPKYGDVLGTGGDENAEIGTGDSGPAGVDARIEYNGLQMNIRRNVDAYLINSIDGLHDADIRDARELNPADDGETYFKSFYGGRTITLTGKVRTGNLKKLRDMQQALRQAFNDLNTEYPLIFHMEGDGTKSLMINCKKHQPMAMGEVQQNFQFEREFQISLRASNPRFLSYFPVFTNIASNASGVVINKGNYPAQPVYTVTGPITNPIISNDTTGLQLRITAVIPSNNHIRVDIAKRKIQDNFGANRFDTLDIASDWMTLRPGQNTVTLTGTSPGANSGLSIQHSDSYL